MNGGNGGFEEWSVRTSTTAVPTPPSPPATLSSLAGAVYLLTIPESDYISGANFPITAGSVL